MKLMDIWRQIVSPVVLVYPKSEIGNKIVIKLDSERRIEFSLNDSCVRDHYDEIVMCLFSNRVGKINESRVGFGDVFEYEFDMRHPNMIRKYIWRDGHGANGFSWYGKPTGEDIDRLRNVMGSYISMWE